MNKVFLVTYHLKTPGKDYSPLYTALKSSGKWWHFLESSWLICTSETSVLLNNRLMPFITATDRLLIIEVRNDCQGWLPKEAWDWIKENVPPP